MDPVVHGLNHIGAAAVPPLKNRGHPVRGASIGPQDTVLNIIRCKGVASYAIGDVGKEIADFPYRRIQPQFYNTLNNNGIIKVDPEGQFFFSGHKAFQIEHPTKRIKW